MVFFLLLSLISIAAEPEGHFPAEVTLTRAYVVWQGDQASIAYETVCQGIMQVPQYDFRKKPWQRPEAKYGEFSCNSYYAELPLQVTVLGRLEKVQSGELGLSPEEELQRAHFLLVPEIGESFPYLNEAQNVTGWSYLTPNLNWHEGTFFLSPEVFVQVSCYQGTCKVVGPRTVFRAKVRFL